MFFSVFKKNKVRQQTHLDQKLIYSLSKSKIPNLKQFKYFNFYLNRVEKIFLYFSLFVLFASIGFLSINFYKHNLVIIPASGGEYSEALIGYPKYINPLYSSVSDADSDVTNLIFSSLFKRGGNADLATDLVTDYSVSEDGKVYTFNIREDAYWHNREESLKANDIVFTFNAIKNDEYKSPLRSRFLGVKIEETGDYQVKFILEQPYTPFVELLTFGILPHYLWSEISPETASLSELNLWPIGSGPYEFKSSIKDKKSGRIKEYHLVINDEYYGKKPYIEKLNFSFFVNYEEAIYALNQNAVNAIGYLPQEYYSQIISKESYNFNRIELPQITAIFFNQNNNEALKDKDIRKALAMSVNKIEIEENFNGQIATIHGPFLPNSFGYNPDINKLEFNQAEAGRILDEKGWKAIEIKAEDINAIQAQVDASTASSSEEISDEEIKVLNEKLEIGEGVWRQKDGKYLKIKLSAIDNQENIAILESIKNHWERVGVKTELEFYPSDSILSSQIKPRKYEALFYSQILGQDPDPYAFWHSSQANNGLNLSDFENKDVDKLLEEARVSMNYDLRAENYKKFQSIIGEEVPAVFMHSQTYTYLQNKKIKGFDVKKIINPYDRFANISEWYLETKKKLSL